MTLEPLRHKATVLMIYSPTCPFCERNWPTWSSTIDKTTNSQIDFAVIDVTAKATEDFVNSKHIGRAKAMHKIDPKDFMSLSLNVTPQTIVIGQDGKVKKVWTGVLTESEAKSLRAMIGSSS